LKKRQSAKQICTKQAQKTNKFLLKQAQKQATRKSSNKPANSKKHKHEFAVSSEISDLCEISDLLLLFSYFASQNTEIKFGNYFFDVCCENWNVWSDARYPQQAI